MASVPTTIGRYTVQRVLGRGGMGTVYLASDPLIDREVAIKVLPPAGDDEHAKRLLAEARVSGRLVHPHIVGVFDIGEEHGQPFVVMPYVPGRTLASILTDADRPPLAVKLRWMRELCAALAYAHGRRVIHRDIKPSNLLIDERGELRVLDFGIAKVLTTSQIKFTSVGTPAYMAPEQYSTEPVDPRTDIFAAGLVLFELIAHRRALSGDSPAQIYGQLMAGRLPRLADAAPGVDPALAAVCDRAIARDPADRFQTAIAFGEALADIREAPPAPAAPPPAMDRTAATVVATPVPPPAPAAAPEVPSDSTLPVPGPVAVAAAVPVPVSVPVAVPASTIAVPPPVPPRPDSVAEAIPDAGEEIRAGAIAVGASWRPSALTLGGAAVVLVVGVAIALMIGTGPGPDHAEPAGAEGDPLPYHVSVPELRHRPPVNWVHGIEAPGCKGRLAGVPVVYGEPPVAVHAAAAGCTPEGEPDPAQTVLFRETPADVRVLWRPKVTGDDLGLSMFPSIGGRVMMFVEDGAWHFVRVSDGQVEARSGAAGRPLELTADGRTLVFALDSGHIGLYDVASLKTTLLPDTTDGEPLTSPASYAGVSETGRYVLFTSLATNLPGHGATADAARLYLYDRTTRALGIVDPNIGLAPRAGFHMPAVISSDGSWTAYISARREPALVSGRVADPSIYLYAYQASTRRTVFVDSVPAPPSGDIGYLAPMAFIDANLLLYTRHRVDSTAVEYIWRALPGGGQRTVTIEKTALANVAAPSMTSPRCLRWIDGSAWCVQP